jgi:exodeoxyribonuclease VII small subunit
MSSAGQERGTPGTLPFEESLARLEKIVERLQRDDVPLDEALELFKEGTVLTTRCDELLSAAELRIQDLTRAVHERFAGYEAEPMEPEEP